MRINLVMPMGGAGTRFFNKGYDCPKPLLTIKNKPFFYWAAQSVLGSMAVESLTFVVLREHVERFGIDQRIKERYPWAAIRTLDHVLNGAVLTAMEGAKAVENDLPVLFCDCDLKFENFSMAAFYAEDTLTADGTIATFRSTEPKFSFVKRGEDGFVRETAEKKAISDEAVCGAYGFRDKTLFLKAAEEYLSECPYQEYFMSGVYNVLIKKGCRIRSFLCEEMVSFGTPEEYAAAEKVL
ncbi:MAG: dolichyl-phosphate mannose synthase [Lachnospiraceae bacterium]|nr:dolichyl-phosphate mannose synthase [Lachnospiraceae bacterium]